MTSLTCRNGKLAVLAFSLTAFVSSVANEPASTNAATDDSVQKATMTFKTIFDMAPSGKVQLANGKTANVKDFRTLLMAIVGKQTLSDGSVADIICTGTLVGPGVFLTAAHCLDRGAGYPLTTSIDLWLGGGSVQTTCTVADAYRAVVEKRHWDGYVPRVSQDYALCRFNVPANATAFFNSMDYEVVDVSDPLNATAKVLMSGFGCARLEITAGGEIKTAQSDKVLRVGDEVIRSAAVGGKDPKADFVSIASDPSADPALCPGDSGGPLLSGVTVDSPNGSRRIRGVNSKISAEPGPQGYIAVSSVAALGTPDFVAFENEWRRANTDRPICGLDVSYGVPPCAP